MTDKADEIAREFIIATRKRHAFKIFVSMCSSIEEPELSDDIIEKAARLSFRLVDGFNEVANGA